MKGHTQDEFIRSKLSRELFMVNSATKKAIIYNKVLFNTKRDYYTNHGWRLLTQHYAAFLFTLEKEYGFIGIAQEKINELKEYATRYVSVVDPFVLTEQDISMFNYVTELLILYINQVKGYRRLRTRMPKVLAANKMGPI